MEIVLDAGKLLAEQADVVIVDQGDGAHHLGVGRFPGLFDQFLADQVAKSFGAVGVAAPADQLIELLQEDAIDGHANPAQSAHAYIIVASAKWFRGKPGDRRKTTAGSGLRTRGQTGLAANFRQNAPEIHASLVSPGGARGWR